MSENEEEKKKSFWSTLPGILTGLAAVITAVGGLIGVLNSAGVLRPGTNRPTPTVRVTPTTVTSPTTGTPAPTEGAVPPPTPVLATAVVDQEGCFGQYFEGVPSDRALVLKEGTLALQLKGLDATQSGVLAFQLTEAGEPLGAIRVDLLPKSKLFRVQSVVDAECQEVDDYFVVDRGGERKVLQDQDTLQIRLGPDEYVLRLGYVAGTVEVERFRIVSSEG